MIDLLVSRTTGGTVNQFNTADSALSYATIAGPVFQEISIDGTTSQSGTYLYQYISSGLNNLPNFKYNADRSSLELRRIFKVNYSLNKLEVSISNLYMYEKVTYELAVDQQWVLFCILDDINRVFFNSN